MSPKTDTTCHPGLDPGSQGLVVISAASLTLVLISHFAGFRQLILLKELKIPKQVRDDIKTRKMPLFQRSPKADLPGA